MLLAFLEFTPNNCQLFGIKGVYTRRAFLTIIFAYSVSFIHSTINKLALASCLRVIIFVVPIKVRCFLRSSNLMMETKRYEHLTKMKQSISYIYYPAIGTLSNLDDELSGRRKEVFSRSRQLLRMSVMSSMWRSGRNIC